MIVRSEMPDVAERQDDAVDAYFGPETERPYDDLGEVRNCRVRERQNGGRPEPLVFDATFAKAVRDASAGVWSLQVTHFGGVELVLNQDTAAILSNREGAVLLRAQGCPFERAVDLIAAVLGKSAAVMSVASRTDLEFDLARWIPLYFDL